MQWLTLIRRNFYSNRYNRMRHSRDCLSEIHRVIRNKDGFRLRDCRNDGIAIVNLLVIVILNLFVFCYLLFGAYKKRGRSPFLIICFFLSVPPALLPIGQLVRDRENKRHKPVPHGERNRWILDHHRVHRRYLI